MSASAASAAAAPPAKRARPAALEARVSTLALPAAPGRIWALAVDADGTTFVATVSALFVLGATGRFSLLAGSRSERGFKDGPGHEARFNGPRGLAVAAEAWTPRVAAAAASPEAGTLLRVAAVDASA